MESTNVVQILSYGVIGLGFLLALMAYRLLFREQSKKEPNALVLKSISTFMAFSLALCVTGLFSEMARLWISSTSTDSVLQQASDVSPGGTGDSIIIPGFSYELKIILYEAGDFHDLIYNVAQGVAQIPEQDTSLYCVAIHSSQFPLNIDIIPAWEIKNTNGDTIFNYNTAVQVDTNPSAYRMCQAIFTELSAGNYTIDVEVLRVRKSQALSIL